MKLRPEQALKPPPRKNIRIFFGIPDAESEASPKKPARISLAGFLGLFTDFFYIFQRILRLCRSLFQRQPAFIKPLCHSFHRLSHFYQMAVRIVKADHSLSPAVLRQGIQKTNFLRIQVQLFQKARGRYHALL